MPTNPTSRHYAWRLFLAAIALFSGAWAAYRFAGFDNHYVWWVAGELLVVLSLPAFSVVAETSVFPLLYLVVAALLPATGHWLGFPWVVATLVILAHPLASRGAWLLVALVSLGWLDIPALIASPPASWVAYAFLAGGAVGLVLPLLATGKEGGPVRNIDMLLCSYTGNTAHYAQSFRRAAEAAGAQVTEHRFHYHKDFRGEFPGDALVVAYPVAGWQPFWPILEYLLFKLPRGDGKAAFLLSSSAGGPENSHLVPWLALWARGYRVLGHLGATYPVNIPFARMASSRFMRLFDTLLPRPTDTRLVEKAAATFCSGRRAGFGFWVFPCVLFILGPLTYNRYINYIFRSYSFKRLCNNCGICIRFCPTERLYMKNGRVRSKGTCTLCFGCVNLCPTDAVQILLLTEFGNVYSPRWPKLVVRKKPTQQPKEAQ